MLILAGERYRKHLIPHFEDQDIPYEIPHKGLGIGQQLSWLTIGFTLTDGDLLETPVRIIGRLLSSTPLIGDFTGDGVVGFADFLLFAVAFGSSDSRFDLTDVGVLGFQDFLIFANMFRSGN